MRFSITETESRPFGVSAINYGLPLSVHWFNLVALGTRVSRCVCTGMCAAASTGSLELHEHGGRRRRRGGISGAWFPNLKEEGVEVAGIVDLDFTYEGQRGAIREFLAALQGGPVPQGECHDNIKSLAMVFGAIESSRKGRRVAIHA